jgi:DinB superfamily
MPLAMHPITLAALEAFPAELEKHYAAFPADYVHWAPPSWEGVPSEPFTAIEQVCHVRDIEVEGYHARFTRTLHEHQPILPSIDSEAVARERNYGAADTARVFAEFRAARAFTVALLRGLEPSQFDRRAEFAGYGPVSLRSLVHYLCSHDQQHLAGLQWLLGKVDVARVPA